MEVYVHAQARHKVLLNELDNLPADKRAVFVQAQREVIDTMYKSVVALRPHLT